MHGSMRSSRSSCPARRAKSRDEECVCACVRVCPKCRAVQRSSADATARRLDFEAVCAYAHDSCACVCCLRAYVSCVRRAGGLGSDVWRGARASTVSINQRIASLHLPADARRVGVVRGRGRGRGKGRGRGAERGHRGSLTTSSGFLTWYSSRFSPSISRILNSKNSTPKVFALRRQR